MSWAKTASDAARARWIAHPYFQRAESELLAALLTADPGEVIAIVGPSRVGKSTLMKNATRILSDHTGAMSDGMLPIVTIDLENDDVHSKLDGKTLMIQGLEALQHPMYGVDRPDDLFGIERVKLLDRTSQKILRAAFRSSLKHRGTKYLVIDEAGHFQYTKGGLDAAAALLDSLKSMTAKLKIVIVLIGAYPLLKIMSLTPHLIGRKLQIHFPRYRSDRDDELLVFDQILAEYSKDLRLEGANSLRDWNELLHQGSLGCLGLLRAWLRDALNRAWLDDSEALTRRHLEDSLKFNSDLDSLKEEIRFGEEYLTRPSAAIQSRIQPMREDPQQSKNTKPKRRNKPFTRNPTRDPVQVDMEASHGE